MRWIRRGLVTFLIIAILVGGFSLFSILSRPQLTIDIQDDTFNPITTKLFVNEQFAQPRGQNGRSFTVKAKNGNNTISLRGPFVEYSQEVSLEFFENQSISILPVAIEAKTIVAKTLNIPEATLQDSRVFASDSAIIAYVAEVPVKNSFPLLFMYNKEKSLWSEISENYVLNEQQYTFSNSLKEYFDALSTD